MKQGKVWGSTELLLNNGLIEIHRIQINPNSFCSLHRHNFKNNAFYVISGTLYLEVHKKDYNLTDITTLKQGQISNIEPGEYHKFFTKEEPVECLEVYFLNPIKTDIERLDVGGKI
jgi:mannose-6-phosphate isomerase-like protein (cupin superfamily)